MHTQLSIFNVNSYHNTVPITDMKELDKAEARAKRQENAIMRLFEQHPHADFTPYEVYMRLGQQWPKGSIQRAITNLTKGGKLQMMDAGKRRDGEFKGIKTNVWKIRK